MTMHTTLVEYRGHTHTFLTPAAETIGNLLDGAVEHFNAPVHEDAHYALVINGDTLPIDESIRLVDAALRSRLQNHPLRLVTIYDGGDA